MSDLQERLALPEEWEWKKVEDVIEKVPLTGKKMKQSDYLGNGKLPVIDQGQSFIGGYTDNECQKISCESPVVIFGDHTKAIKYVDFDFVAGADGIQVMKPKKIFHPKLFYYFVRAIRLPDKGYARHYQLLEESQIPLPPLPTQRRIVSILEKAEEIKRLRAQVDELTDRLLQSVFLEMFGDPVKNPKGWEIKKIKDISEKFSDGPFGSNLKTEHYENKGVRVIRLQNICISNFLDDNKAYISEKHFSTLQKHTCLPGDVLIGTMGDPNLRACIIPQSIELAVNKADCIQCRPNKNLATSEYICHLLNLPSTLNMVSNMIHGETRSRISMGQLSTLRIPLPPLSLQQKFARIVEKVESMRQSQNQSKQQIEDLFSALMQKAFKGELVT